MTASVTPMPRGHLVGGTGWAVHVDYEGEAIARQQITYTCRQAHPNTMTFAADALVPVEWSCKKCGLPAGLDPSNPPPDPLVVDAFKTHFEYVQERRTEAEGDALIAEAIANMRARGL